MSVHRPMFVHASHLRPDQIRRLKAVGGVPSFLTSGLIPGGETVMKLWGSERAANAMAAMSLEQAGLPCPHELVGATPTEAGLTPQARRTLAMLEAAAR